MIADTPDKRFPGYHDKLKGLPRARELVFIDGHLDPHEFIELYQRRPTCTLGTWHSRSAP